MLVYLAEVAGHLKARTLEAEVKAADAAEEV
jgi:hypothetical protein